MVFGEDSGLNSTTDSGPRIHTGASYQHVMGSANSPMADAFPSFTMEFTDREDTGGAGTQNLKRVYTGCRVNNFTLTGSVDEPVKCAIDWIGQGVTVSTGAPTAVTAVTKDPFVFYQGQVYATSGAITGYTNVYNIAANEIAEVNSFSFGVNNNLEAIWYISGTTATTQTLRGLKALLAKGRDYSCSLNLHFKNKTMYQRFLGSASATTGGGATLAKYQIALDFARSGTPGVGVKAVTDDWFRLVMGSCAFNSENIAGAPEDIVGQNIDVFVPRAKLYVVDADASYS